MNIGRDGRIIAVVDAESHTVSKQIDTSYGAHDIVATRNLSRAFISNE